MREFFRGWRRKAGCVTLVVACVGMVGGVRGYAVEDVWQPKYGMVVDGFQHAPVQHHFRSSRYGITWHKSKGLDDTSFGWVAGWSTNSLVEAAQVEVKIRGDIKSRWSWGGFDFCYSEKDEARFLRLRIPYWSLVLPLTAISSWLLLSKPKKPAAIPAEEAT